MVHLKKVPITGLLTLGFFFSSLVLSLVTVFLWLPKNTGIAMCFISVYFCWAFVRKLREYLEVN